MVASAIQIIGSVLHVNKEFQRQTLVSKGARAKSQGRRMVLRIELSIRRREIVIKEMEQTGIRLVWCSFVHTLCLLYLYFDEICVVFVCVYAYYVCGTVGYATAAHDENNPQSTSSLVHDVSKQC